MASCPSDYDWARNSQGMDPCTVASRLKAVCRSDPALSPLSRGQSYPAPTAQDQTDCSCSSVVYYLVAACADCQHGSYGTWKDWSNRCNSPAVDYYPRPAPDGVSIPNWAYFDVGTIPKYDPAFAKANSPSPSPRPATGQATTTEGQGQATSPATTIGNTPSNPDPSSTSPTLTATATATVTGTSTGTSTDTSTGSDSSSGGSTSAATGTDAAGRTNASGSQTTTSDGSNQSALNAAFSSDTLTGPGHSRITIQPTGSSGQSLDSAAGKKSNTGVIVAGVMGTLLFLAILGAVLYWWIVRRRRMRVAPSTAYMAAYGSIRPDTSMSTRALADRSASVLNITHTNTDAFVPYHDDEENRGKMLVAPSEPHEGQVSRASSIDHYRTS